MSHEDTDQRQTIINAIKSLLQPKEIAPSRENLGEAAKELNTITPYNYDAWRVHADLLLTALKQVTTRQIPPDPSFTLLTVPLKEEDLRDAAEVALRQCAIFADSSETAIKLVDEANRIRRITWF